MAKRLQDTATAAIGWERVRGRCGVDDPATLPPDMAAEAINWSINFRGLGQKRYGSSNQTPTGAFTGFNVLARFIPGQNEAAAEFHFISGDPKFMRVAAGAAAVEYSTPDPITASPHLAHWAVGNGKLFWAYKSGLNRLHVYIPGVGMVRAGLPAPGAPTAADLAAGGTYPAVARTYRIQVKSSTGGLSDLGPASAAFTPIGNKSGVRVTPAAFATNENITHFRVYGSTNSANYYLLSGWITTATGFFDDTILTTAYASQPAAPLEGAYYPLPSAKFLLWDGTHLLLFGSWGDQAGNALPAVDGRVYVTRALDSLTEGGEDVSIAMTQTIKGYIDINRNGNSEDRGLVGPVDGVVLALQSRGIYLLKPTNAPERVYTRVPLSLELGAVSQQSSFVGEDEQGRVCAYWLDPERGAYRYGAEGLQWCGYDLQDVWDRVNLDASIIAAHGVYDPTTRRCYWWIAVDGANEPNLGIVLHVKEARPTATEGVRYGWTIASGLVTRARCSLMFAERFASPMPRKRKPYAGFAGTATHLLRAGDRALTTDAGVPFRAHILSKAWITTDVPKVLTVDRTWVQAPTTDNVVLFQRFIRNYNDDEPALTATDLQPQGDESRRIFLFEDAQLAGAWTFQTELGDAEAVGSFYSIDRWQARLTLTDLEVGTSHL